MKLVFEGTIGLWRILVATFVVALTMIPTDSRAAITVSLRDGGGGATCATGSTTIPFSGTELGIPVLVCVTATTESLCGISYRLRAASMQGGAFFLGSRAASAAYSFLYSAPTFTPFAIGESPAGIDLGAGTQSNLPESPSANQLVATLSFVPQPSATGSSYVIHLDPVSVVSVDNGAGDCSEPVEQSISASVTLTKGTPPSITSASTATFTVGFTGTFQVTADGTPAPTLSIGGQALPANVTFTPATGVLTGIPQLGTVGTYNLTFTAANGNLPNATQNFTLTVQKANQAITFGPLANKTFGDASFMVAATTNASGLSVTFSSGTPATCSVTGSTVALLAAGTCTVNADQAGNANYNAAATVAQSFTIAAGTPGAPTIGTATAGNGSATVGFTAPMNTGGAPIQSYTATCGAQTATGPASPLTVSGLVNGTPVTCTVTAFNGTATSAPSAASNSVTPLAQFTVTPSAGANGSVMPALPVTVTQGNTTSFTVTPDAGYVASASGCGGSLVGNTYTTAAITMDCTVSVAFVALITYNVVLEGAQETPPLAVTGTGSGTAVVNTVANSISLNLAFSGLTGAATAAHLHGPANRGAAAGVKINIGTTSPITNVVTYSEADEADILAGRWYVNIHTAAHPGGELRGQLDNLGPANKALSVSVVGTGTVTGTGINCPGDCSESYAHNTVVALTATPGTGFTFTGWSGACSGTGACNVTMNLLKSVTATFTINSYALGVATTGTGSGSVTGTGINCPGDCNEDFTHGTMVTLTAAANAGSSFAGWSGGGCSGTGMCTVTMDAAKSVTATFTAHITYNVVLEGAQETPPLSVTATGSGTAVVDTVANTITLNLTFTGLTGAATAAHLHGPAPRGTAAGVKINLGTTSPITNVVTYMEADEADILAGASYVNIHTATHPGGELRGQLDNLGAANKQLSVALAGNGGGTVTGTGINCPGDCNETYGHNTLVVLTATPAMGSTFAGWSGGGCSGTGTCSVTMDFYKTVTATFTLNTYTVTASAGTNGTIAPDMPVAVLAGGTLAFTVTPGMGFVASVSGTCGGMLSGNTFTTAAIFADCTVVASFTPDIALVRVESRKVHGAFTCNVPITTGIPIDGNVSVEPRNGAGGHLIVFVFDGPVTSVGTATVTPSGTAIATASGNEVRVTLNGMPDGSRATVTLSGVNGAVDASASMGFLLGDFTGTRSINVADILTTKARLSPTLTTANCAADVNVDGQVSSSDVSAVKNRSGNVLP
jgi:hypothetical protein